MAKKTNHFVIGFNAAHLAAVKNHAPTSMGVSPPATLECTNEESMHAAITS